MNISIKISVFIGLACFAGLFSSKVLASSRMTDQPLTKCLDRAQEWPDQTIAFAHAWEKRGGGDLARICHAYAQFYRGEYAAAAQEFSSLAIKRKRVDPKQAVSLHVQAGLAAMRANNERIAEAEFSAALNSESQDPEIWLDRATERATMQRYWDALKDVDKALSLMPDMPEALRLRGQIREKLGQDISAKADFERAALIEDAEQAARK